MRRWRWYLSMSKCFKSVHAQHAASVLLSQQAGERGCQYTTLKPGYLFIRAAAMNLITDKKPHAEKFVLIYAPRRPAAERTVWERREIWSVIGTGSDFSSSQGINIWMQVNGIKIRERNTLFFLISSLQNIARLILSNGKECSAEKSPCFTACCLLQGAIWFISRNLFSLDRLF